MIGDIDALQRAVATSMYEQARQRRILAPAEAINVLSIGALHADAATAPASDTVLDTAITGMPAQYSPVGFGYRNSAKPEFCYRADVACTCVLSAPKATHCSNRPRQVLLGQESV